MPHKAPTRLSAYLASSSPEVKQICQPLNTLKISFFLYTRNYPDGSQAWLINNADWEIYFYEQELYKRDCLRVPEKTPAPTYKFNLWKCMPDPCQEIFGEARNFNIDHGVTLIEHGKEFNETWHFGTTPENHSIHDLYVNKTELLDRFTHYFRDQAKPLIAKAEKERQQFIFPDEHHQHAHEIQEEVQQDLFDEFIKQTTLKRLYLGKEHGNTYLTARELECIHWLKKGKSVEEIAMILDMKTSTAQSHIENIKKKFDCYKQFSLGYHIAKLDGLVE